MSKLEKALDTLLEFSPPIIVLGVLVFLVPVAISDMKQRERDMLDSWTEQRLERNEFKLTRPDLFAYDPDKRPPTEDEIEFAFLQWEAKR